MRRNEQRFQRFLNRAFGPFLNVPQQQVDSACERVLNRLRDERESHLERVVGVMQRIPKLAEARRRFPWPAAAFVAASVAFAVIVPERVRSAPGVFEDSDGSRRVSYGEVVAPADSEGGTLELTNGSRVEMRSNSALSLERSNEGVRVRVRKGDVIVNAAVGSSEPLVVETKDLSAVGKVLLVNASEQGTLIGAVGGEVRVQQGANEKKLLPGEQVSSNPQLNPIAVGRDIGWSRNAAAYMASLEQEVVLTGFQKPAGERVAFELVSIRPRDPEAAAGGRGGGGPSVECALTFQSDPQRFVIRNANVYTLVAMAYVPGSCLMARQLDLISGGPGWVRSDRFDIEAILPAGSTTYTPAQLFQGHGAERLQMMLRTMLTERFGLVLKSEVKARTGYVLTNSAGESKLKPWDAGKTVKDADTGREQASGCGMRTIPDQEGQRMSGDINCWNVPMSSFINSLAFLISRPVLDQTNLGGMYEYNLKFAHPDYRGTSPSTFPSLPAAVREQLGLRLENTKAPVEVLVIDRVEKPSAN